ncbi:MAG TPA: ATP-binding cassette domain-containing protein [Oscillospiraceae bacterium]|nr:ATP-binding cassette domain-containing protein [Oscillospiraceae bacterium]
MINLKNIHKGFDDKVLFEDFNIDIPDGEFLAFTGDSGCGKTTMLNMIGALEKPDSGQIIVDGKDIYQRKNRRSYFAGKVGFLFQNFALVESKTVRQNLEFVRRGDRTNLTVKEVLKNVGIADKADTKVYKLSGGEQQRVALARLMLKKCDIILADEPTGSLDVRNAAVVMDILHKMNETGKTIIIVTHNENIMTEAKRVVRL